MVLNEKSILEMARGAIMEQVDIEVGNVMTNITNPNTKPTQKREIDLKIIFEPSEDRTQVKISANAKSKLAPYTPVQTTMYVGENNDGEIFATEMSANIPGQYNFDNEVEERPKNLKMVVGGNK